MKSVLHFFAISIMVLAFLSCRQSPSQKQSSDNNTNTISSVKDTCEGPDANINCDFIGMPDNLSNVMTIAKESEPGTRMIIKGKVIKADGTPYSGVIIYAYHTDNDGYYSKKGNEKGVQKWHGHLHGWCKSDENGNYEIHSIRPARYPENKFAAHIHSALKTPDNQEPFYINDFVFKDDEFVDAKYLSNLPYEGGTGVVDLQKDPEGVYFGERIITLDK